MGGIFGPPKPEPTPKPLPAIAATTPLHQTATAASASAKDERQRQERRQRARHGRAQTIHTSARGVLIPEAAASDDPAAHSGNTAAPARKTLLGG